MPIMPKPFIREIQRLIGKHLTPLLVTQTQYSYIEHYKNAHHNVPLWVPMNVLTFGTISKMYTLSKTQIQSAVSRAFEFINEKQLGQILQVLTDDRNVCAHGERLFSHRSTPKEIPELPLHRKLSIPQRGTNISTEREITFLWFSAFDIFCLIMSFLTTKSSWYV